MALRLITITTFFPNSADPIRAVFVANLVRALRCLCDVSVVSPVVYAPPFLDLKKWRDLRNIATVERFDEFDVLHPRFAVFPKLHWPSGFSYCLGILLTLVRIKRVTRNCVLHAHFAYPDGVGVALAARLLRLPFVVTVHGSDINVYSTRRTLWPQIRWALCNATYVIVVSRDLERKLLARSNGTMTHLHYVPCAGFDPAIFFPRDRALARAKLNQVPNSRIVVFVGQLVTIKGIEHLIDAWGILMSDGRVSTVDKIVMIGEGDNKHKLEARATHMGINESIWFAGALNQSDISDWLAASDLLCLPSLNEGTPNVVIEALASGRPVVATSVGGVPEIVVNEENGILIKPANVLELAQGLEAAFAKQWNAEAIVASVAHLTWAAIAIENKHLLDEYFPEKNSATVD